MTYRAFQVFAVLAGAVFLAGCGDPLRNVDRLSSVELDEAALPASVAAAPQETEKTGGFLSALLKRDKVSTPPPDPDATVLAAPEATAEELAAQSETVAALPAEPKRRGLFGFLRGTAKRTAEPDAQAVEIASAVPETDEVVSVALAEPQKAEEVTEAAPQAETRPRKGLFGLLAGARAKATDDNAAGETVQTASLGGAATQPRRTGRASGNGPDAALVPAGTRLAPGAVARVCDVKRGEMGKVVGRFPERGKGYKIYDSAPGGTGPRPFYVTGFKDGCARTFTAALALFGSPTMHEQLRYGLPSQVQPYSATDKAYEGIKSAVCRVGKRKPCGSKVGLLEKDTAFISIYDRIGSNSKWSNILLHRGTVVAADRKG